MFDGKCFQMTSKLSAARPSLSLSFRDLFRISTFWCILVAPWFTFGSFLTPVGSLLGLVSSLVVPFGLPLPPSSNLLAASWCLSLLFAPSRYVSAALGPIWYDFRIVYTCLGVDSKLSPAWPLLIKGIIQKVISKVIEKVIKQGISKGNSKR